jgi:F-type H+-transporting ATPase subunit epsilon
MQSDKLIHVEIITPQRILYSGEASSVTIPGEKSPFQVLFNHASIVSSLEPGVIKIESADGKTELFAAGGGLAEVRDNKVSILASSAEFSKNVDINRCQSRIEELTPMISKAKEDEAPKLINEQKYLKTQLKIADNAKMK